MVRIARLTSAEPAESVSFVVGRTSRAPAAPARTVERVPAALPDEKGSDPAPEARVAGTGGPALDEGRTQYSVVAPVASCASSALDLTRNALLGITASLR
ncbi:hypothetical protein ACE1SV_64820 [Streptomyces sennicomposti]